MARHKRSYAGERRTAGLRVQLTPGEREELQDAAKQQGAPNLSSYAREMLFRRSAAVVAATRRNPEAAALMRDLQLATRQLNGAGNNLNQIARELNTTGDLRDWRELRDALRDYQHGIDMYKLAVGRVLDL
ncbi:MAG TPA: plasmid mobilization relaxosome protein MobC [Polyangiaceae bacterium]|nr:plasmid mobilization relaxosome protein MobC [Polyangiaceae bacterium]